VRFRDLVQKIDLKLRPFQMGDGQQPIDDLDRLFEERSASATEKAPPGWVSPAENEDEGQSSK
jgi:hypothetical protein